MYKYFGQFTTKLLMNEGSAVQI